MPSPRKPPTARTGAYKRGMHARNVLLHDDNVEKYDRLYNDTCVGYDCPTVHQEFLIKQMVDAQWRLERLKGIETALLDDDEIDPIELERVSRWQVRMENSYYKAAHELRAIRKLEEEKERQDEEEEEQPPIALTWHDEDNNLDKLVAIPPGWEPSPEDEYLVKPNRAPGSPPESAGWVPSPNKKNIVKPKPESEPDSNPEPPDPKSPKRPPD